MPEISTCGLDMNQFKDGDFSGGFLGLNQLIDIKELEGTWEDIKKISQPIDPILNAAGVGFIKRKATAIATLKTEITVKSTDADGNPMLHFKTYYPLGIVKELQVVTDGTTSDIYDPDTCDWKATSVWCDGRLIQKRTGKKGTMYDARVVLKSHPTGATDEKPIMLFLWTIVDAKGNKYQAQCWMKKVA